MRGDRRTPEGEFYICTMSDSNRFYKFMGLSYPGLKHAEAGLRSEMISPVEYAMIKKAIEGKLPPPWETRIGGAVWGSMGERWKPGTYGSSPAKTGPTAASPLTTPTLTCSARWCPSERR